MEVKNRMGIDVELYKTPMLLQGETKRRGEDLIQLRIKDFEECDTDLILGDDIQLSFTNEQAAALAKQLIDCIMENVDEEFMKAFPGVPPFKP